MTVFTYYSRFKSEASKNNWVFVYFLNCQNYLCKVEINLAHPKTYVLSKQLPEIASIEKFVKNNDVFFLL